MTTNQLYQTYASTNTILNSNNTGCYYTTTATPWMSAIDNSLTSSYNAEFTDVIIKGRLKIIGDDYYKNTNDDELNEQFIETYNNQIKKIIEQHYNKFKWDSADDYLTSIIYVKNLPILLQIDVRCNNLYIKHKNSIMAQFFVNSDMINKIKALCVTISRTELLDALREITNEPDTKYDR